jgi:hypothetical protein
VKKTQVLIFTNTELHVTRVLIDLPEHEDFNLHH